MGSGGLRGLQNRWLHNQQRQVRFLPLPVFVVGEAMLNVLFVAAFSADAENLARLSKNLWHVDYVLDNRETVPQLAKKSYDVLFFDVEVGGIYPPDVLHEVYHCYQHIAIFLLSRQHCNPIERKVAACRYLAGCFLIPYDFSQLVDAVSHFDTTQKAKSRYLDESLKTTPLYTQLQGQSIEIQIVRNFILDAANRPSHVLLYGESGAGKEVVASLIHQYSKNRDGRYLPVNTTCITAELAESLLFGSCKGAYTGAIDKDGLLAHAHRGTLFFDEIENIPLELQAKLLRALETHEYYKLGGYTKYYSDFRLICATNRDLQEMVDDGVFRLDLFYRLDVFHLLVPPLRHHKEDIAMLASNYLKASHKHLSDEALAILTDYNWPGNVRELLNCLDRAIFAAKDSPVIYPQYFDI